jgi:S-adenosylmethionine:tRNA ribosyltransferase-isomerase
MKTKDFDYQLPPDLIAQTPVEPRHSSRLFFYDRVSGKREHAYFWHLPRFLKPGDLLVVNQTKVIPARIYAYRPTGGKVELLLLKKRDEMTWETLVGGKKILPGIALKVDDGPDVYVLETLEASRRVIRFSQPIESYLEDRGEMPLPPYIHEKLLDKERYQTVYARESGSAAAPTAGLHFTPELMSILLQQGIGFAEVTLHVGLDTFAPVTEDDPEDHMIHTEWCEVNAKAVQTINSTRKNGGRIIAVGTTTARTLETAGMKAGGGEVVTRFNGPTELFILPGYRFRTIDGLITNFHLPKSSLIMMVSAFMGREKVLELYQEAIQEKYRFYSFGDAMLIL